MNILFYRCTSKVKLIGQSSQPLDEKKLLKWTVQARMRHFQISLDVPEHKGLYSVDSSSVGLLVYGEGKGA